MFCFLIYAFPPLKLPHWPTMFSDVMIIPAPLFMCSFMTFHWHLSSRFEQNASSSLVKSKVLQAALWTADSPPFYCFFFLGLVSIVANPLDILAVLKVNDFLCPEDCIFAFTGKSFVLESIKGHRSHSSVFMLMVSKLICYKQMHAGSKRGYPRLAYSLRSSVFNPSADGSITLLEMSSCICQCTSGKKSNFL